MIVEESRAGGYVPHDEEPEDERDAAGRAVDIVHPLHQVGRVRDRGGQAHQLDVGRAVDDALFST